MRTGGHDGGHSSACWRMRGKWEMPQPPHRIQKFHIPEPWMQGWPHPPTQPPQTTLNTKCEESVCSQEFHIQGGTMSGNPETVPMFPAPVILVPVPPFCSLCTLQKYKGEPGFPSIRTWADFMELQSSKTLLLMGFPASVQAIGP